MACHRPKDLHCYFFCQCPIEMFLSIMWKSVTNILWSLQKGFSLLATLLGNSTINLAYETVCQCWIDLVEAAQ